MIIFTQKVHKGTAEYITFFGVPRNQKSKSSLVDFIRGVMIEKNLGLRDVEEISGRKGNKITHGYLSKILSGQADNPSPKKLQALSLGLGVSSKEVFNAARGESYEDSEDFLKSRLGVISLRMSRLGKMSQAKAEVLIDSLEQLVDRLEEQERK